jgi:hypothetical protein
MSKESPKHCNIPLKRIAAADDNLPMHTNNRKYPFWTNVHKGYRGKVYRAPTSNETLVEELLNIMMP